MDIKNKTPVFSFINILLIIILVVTLSTYTFIIISDKKYSINPKPVDQRLWSFQSIDTMKNSRDLALQKLDDPSYIDVIDQQVKSIKNTGANYISIDTPYDERFLPFLQEWVNSARNYNLHIWFRGNWTAWEGWFGTPKQMSFEDHISKSVAFIKAHPDLFLDGDSFTACPECENGAQGDPRQTGKLAEYRKFMITETKATNLAFKDIHKYVYTNWLPMNKDVADKVMDSDTLNQTGGVIVIDHYVNKPEQLASDIDKLAKDRGAKVILGEFGAPIEDINGSFSDGQQAEWLNSALTQLVKSPNLIGLNYWTNQGGSTELWHSDNSPREAVNTLSKFYSPTILYGTLNNDWDYPLSDVQVTIGTKNMTSSNTYSIPVVAGSSVSFFKSGLKTEEFTNIKTGQKHQRQDIILTDPNKTFWHQIWIKLKDIVSTILK